jgi:uncharacterized protein (DUF305 family)
MNKQIVILLIVIAVLVGGYFYARTVGPAENHSAAISQTSEMNHENHSDHAALVTDDKSFIEEMIPHHEEAITSSESLLKVAKSSEVRTLAQDIIDAQKKEVADMKSWYNEWYGREYKPTGNYNLMMSPVDEKNIDASEQKYLKEMIVHHEAATVMAEKALPISKQDTIKDLANNILTSQKNEIETMRSLLNNKDEDHSMH